MSKSIRREMDFPQKPEEVWDAIAESEALAAWMYPNDFQPRLGHRFTFQVPPNPAVDFEGIVVHCEVQECDPPRRLVFSWTAGGPVTGTRVSFQLEPRGDGTRLLFEHSGFDFTQPWADEAFAGATCGWTEMLKQLPAVVANLPSNRK